MTDDRRGPDIAEVVGGLSARAEALCRELLPAGVKEGPEWKVGSVAGEAGRSMSVCLAGERAGVWADFAVPGSGGDALDLVAAVLFGGDKKQGWRWAVSWLGLDGRDAGRLKTRRAVPPKKTAGADGASKFKRGVARALWFGAGPIAGPVRPAGSWCDEETPAAAYLRVRGIDLPIAGKWPGSLRFAWRVEHKETGREHPAMLASVVGRDGKLIACHRTWLQRVPSTRPGAPGRWDKLRGVKYSKMTLGRMREAGGAIRLWRGMDPDPETGEYRPRKAIGDLPDDAAETVILTEGIEDALTLALADPGRRIWCAVSLGQMANVWLPPAVAEVVIARDNDHDNPKADADLARAFEAHRAAGRRVSVIRPPDGCKDFNDLLRRGSA